MPSQQVFNNQDGALYTTSTGAPVKEPYAAQRIGGIGPLLLQGTPHPSVPSAPPGACPMRLVPILSSPALSKCGGGGAGGHTPSPPPDPCRRPAFRWRFREIDG